MRKPHIQTMSGTQDLDKRIANSLFLQKQIVTPYNYSKFINSSLFCIYHFKATFRVGIIKNTHAHELKKEVATVRFEQEPNTAGNETELVPGLGSSLATASLSSQLM